MVVERCPAGKGLLAVVPAGFDFAVADENRFIGKGGELQGRLKGVPPYPFSVRLEACDVAGPVRG